MKILRIPMPSAEWLEKIISGERKRLYLPITPFYNYMLIDTSDPIFQDRWIFLLEELTNLCEPGKKVAESKGDIEYLYNICKNYPPPYKHYDVIPLYAEQKKLPQAHVEIKRIYVDYGDTQYGLEPDRLYYVLEFGEIKKRM